MNLSLYEIEACMEHELKLARAKFPLTKDLLLAFAEESGEFIKAVMDYEDFKATRADVFKEGIQAMAMIARVLQEGDSQRLWDGGTELDPVNYLKGGERNGL